jgi:hypothetical protein
VQFARADDLQRVRGIGPVLAQRLAPHLVLASSAAAAADCTTTPTAIPPCAGKSLSSCNAPRR